ncbi:MAG: glycosyltransferase family 2 protein [Actinobacteria bacterium]|nr:glycosyltransferase family 2 protein [Actinomycetota bacterium]MBW3649176.1 glycosyltransferase family 2 protein [Actinomycetota bacterium]
MIVDCVIPARNEAPTVASVVTLARACRYVREVVVVDDGSTDGTGDLAAAAGAKVVRREDSAGGSKAHAMEAGVLATGDAEAVLFVDADLLGATPAHLDAICRPVVERRAAMSLGTFDYGRLNWFVLRLPPTTGERIVPRWVFDAIPPEKRKGYTIEIMINEVICEARLPTVARVMAGVTHRTKRDKFGLLEGYRRTFRMFADLWSMWGVCRWRTYWFYLRDLRIER